MYRTVLHTEYSRIRHLKKYFSARNQKSAILEEKACCRVQNEGLGYDALFSRKTWIYFMKNKDEVFSKFKEFKALIENHTEKKIYIF